MRAAPSTRLLVACCLATVLLAASAGLIRLVGSDPGIHTAIGRLAFADLLAVALAMGMGGFVARAGFRWIAVALVAATGLAGMLAAWALAPDAIDSPGRWLLRHQASGFVLELVLAWAAAAGGERLAGRRRDRAR